jgi:UDP:flavonoid glycosyltransferase YjiC (YdhE family)
LPGLRDIIRSWKPDVILRESMEFGAIVAAEEAGIPTARVGTSNRQAEAFVVDVASLPLDDIRKEAGGKADGGAGLRAEIAFTSFPPALDGKKGFVGLRPPFRVRAGRERIDLEAIVPGWAIDDGRPLVFITFGTLAVGSERNLRLFLSAVDAAGALPVRALFSTGAAMDPAGLVDVPDNVTVTSWVNPRDVYPRAAVVVCHGGAGTLLAGLAHGVPMVVTPISADQPANGRLLEESGAGLTLIQPDASSLREAIQRALVDPDMRAAAGRIAHEMSLMPSMDDAVREIGRLSGK